MAYNYKRYRFVPTQKTMGARILLYVDFYKYVSLIHNVLNNIVLIH